MPNSQQVNSSEHKKKEMKKLETPINKGFRAQITSVR